MNTGNSLRLVGAKSKRLQDDDLVRVRDVKPTPAVCEREQEHRRLWIRSERLEELAAPVRRRIVEADGAQRLLEGVSTAGRLHDGDNLRGPPESIFLVFQGRSLERYFHFGAAFGPHLDLVLDRAGLGLSGSRRRSATAKTSHA